MNLKEDIKPITYLKNKTKELIDKVSGSDRSVIITQNGEAKVVVMHVEQYERWRNAMAMMKIISQSEADVESGDVLPQEEALFLAGDAIQDQGDE
ncbi:MAG: type II toxin-antitoxin system Phd/YefM family antitoxin [Deltaproteobacteria bacterium]|nr:type II toxin-antitoxin system Phd/YefM family antitoxin [Deltaproteobacteria bacterium]